MATEKQKNHFWTDEETIFMLQRLKESNILKFMDGRRTRNAVLFQIVAHQLKKAGFIRTAEQIRVRWKHVKQSHNAAKRNKQTSVVCRPYSDILEELLGGRSLSQAGDHGVNIGFSSQSVAGVEDLEETTTMEEQSPEGPSETDDEDSLSLSRFSVFDLPGTRSQRSGRRRRRMADFDLFFQWLEEMNDSWMQQLQRSDERLERLVNSTIQSNAAVVSALLEGIGNLRPAVAPLPG